MLRVTSELFPGGRESGRRTLATADIARERSGALADYSIGMNEDLLGHFYTGEIKDYPRWSGSIWDLVARAIAVALTGEEVLPKRPPVPDVPIHGSGVPGAAYVRLREIPEPARTFFVNHIRYETRPIVSEVPDPLDCAHLWEWERFLKGGR